MTVDELNERIIDFLKAEGKTIEKNKEYSLRSLIDIGITIPYFDSVIKEIIVEGELELDDLLYATMALVRLGRTIAPRTFLAIFNKSLQKTLKKQGKTELSYQNNDVLIGEIVSVFNALVLAEQNKTETVDALLGKYTWYKEYKDPLGLVKETNL